MYYLQKKGVFLLIVSKVDIKLNANLKVGYFCTKFNFGSILAAMPFYLKIELLIFPYFLLLEFL